MTSIFRFVILAWLLAGYTVAAAPIALRVGAARADITPETEVLNWVTGKPYGSVLDPLSVHALVLDDGTTKAALLRWDLVDVSESARDEVRQAVATALGMPGENVMVNASHTHSAPWAPVYREGYRGKERDTWWAIRHMPAQNNFPPYKRWMSQLIAASVNAAKRARMEARAVTLSIGRVAAHEYMYNRRPRAPRWGLAESKASPTIHYNHVDWNADALQAGARFGPMDPTLALVSFHDSAGKAVASLFHTAIHAVAIYPSTPAISADWPGAASRALTKSLGGECLFFQGCCGDINPWQRGEPAVARMAEGLAEKAQIAARFAVKLAPGPIEVGRATVNLPLTAEARKRLGSDTVAAEIQVIVCGPLAIVGLPGEPMTDLGALIRDRSPFPQTLVLGYTNGNGAHYVGMPGEKARGGYEAGVAGAGTEECAMLMVDTALRVLADLVDRPGYQVRR